MARPSTLKSEILSAATREFNQNGFGAIGLNELCRRINVAKPTLLYHFADKDELIMEYLRRERFNYADVLDREENRKSKKGLLARSLKALISEAVTRKRGFAHFNVKIEYSGDSKKVRDEGDELYDDFATHIELTIRDSQLPVKNLFLDLQIRDALSYLEAAHLDILNGRKARLDQLLQRMDKYLLCQF